MPSLGSFRLQADTQGERRIRRFPLRMLLLWAIWLALVTAAARPQWTGDPVLLPTSGRDLMLAVDISGSMGTEDMELGGRLVDRLAVVKSVVAGFIGARQGDRMGLILFGTNAYLQAPLTFDLQTVDRFLTEAPVGIAGGKTAIGDAIGLAVKRLRQRPQKRPGPHPADRRRQQRGRGRAAEGGGTRRRRRHPHLHHRRRRRRDAHARHLRILRLAHRQSIRRPRRGDPEPHRRTHRRTLLPRPQHQGLSEVYAIIDGLEPVEQDPETYRPVAALYYWPMGLAWLLACGLLLLDFRSAPRD